MGWVWFLSFVTLFCILGYQRASLNVWTVSVAVFLILFSRISDASQAALVIAWLCFFPYFYTTLCF